jgi:hypothetical protein
MATAATATAGSRAPALLLLLLLLSLALALRASGAGAGAGGDCHFPAVFNFGDSNSDTGGLSSLFGAAPPPNGRTFFGMPAGRYCDGRLVIDFIGTCTRSYSYVSPAPEPLGRHGAGGFYCLLFTCSLMAMIALRVGLTHPKPPWLAGTNECSVNSSCLWSCGEDKS